MDKKEVIDKEIIISLQKGDSSAFEYFLSFYEKLIFNYIFRIVKNREVAKDITQDTFIKVYNNTKFIDVNKNIKTWLFTIATNTTYDFLRSKKSKKEFSLDENIETIDEFDTYYTQGELISDVEKALEAIKLDYREVILLFYKYGFSYQEISEILALPINTIKTNIRRGKEQLKLILKDYGTN